NEIRYASLLHDFGKVGVREPVLVKAEKLYPFELELLRSRFEFAKSRIESEGYKRALDRLVKHGGDAAVVLAEEAEKQAAAYKELDEIFAFILACNRPTVLATGGFERLAEIGARTFTDLEGRPRPYLTAQEVAALSIPKGSLSEHERREIESHVTWTFKFLSQIPWTQTLKGVPDIAYAHHEKLDGRGYPRALKESDIPVQSRMMAISDIYDALTASDRPYKKAVPHDLALDILKRESESGQLDRELFTIFVEARVPERALGSKR
ncbi:MAG: HD-GYP domain-containing protein, partial [Myxococcales bacterium]